MITLFDQPTLQKVTPEMASTWLSTVKEDCYRPVNPHMVSRFTREMRGGQWKPGEGTPILFDALGQLRGGRMRLMAVVESGRTVEMPVQTSPQLQPHETVPGVYDNGPTTVHALRWDGASFDSAKRWIDDDSRDTIGIAMDASRKLTVETQRGIFWVLPGDWLVNASDGYRQQDHFSFAGSFAYRGIA